MLPALVLLLSPIVPPDVAVRDHLSGLSAITRPSHQVSAETARDGETAKAAAPEAKEGKVDSPATAPQPGETGVVSAALDPAESSSAASIGPRNKPLGLPEAPRPMIRGPLESPRQRHLWYGLVFAGHGAAAFDAWSTRRAITSGAAREVNPFYRPFANSGAMYVATQVSPAFMDYLGRRMMRSTNPWVRRMWWLPQSAGAAMSIGAGFHNLSLVK